MKNKNKNVMDDVLKFLQKDRHVKREKIFYKPDKKRSVGGFIFALLFFIIMICFCIANFSFGSVLLLGVSIGLLIFYGANTFTREGLWIQKYVDTRILDKLDDENEIDEIDEEEKDSKKGKRKEQD